MIIWNGVIIFKIIVGIAIVVAICSNNNHDDIKK